MKFFISYDFIIFKGAQTRSRTSTFLPLVTQIKVAIVLLPTNKIFSHFVSKISCAVIAHNTEQQCGLVLRYPSRNRMLSPGDNLPPVWEPLVQGFVKAL